MIVVVAGVLFISACGGSDSSGNGDSGSTETTAAAAVAGDAAAGLELYDATCIACHGVGGIGVDGLGKTFVGSTFIADQTDAELLAFIKVGRDPGDPENTTGVLMPPKGGNPALSDADLTDVIAYLRSIN